MDKLKREELYEGLRKHIPLNLRGIQLAISQADPKIQPVSYGTDAHGLYTQKPIGIYVLQFPG